MPERRKQSGRREIDDPLQSRSVWDRELEEEFVGWMITNQDRSVEVVGSGLQHKHFHGYRARTMFQAIEDVLAAGQSPHFDAIVHALERRNITDVTKLDVLALMGMWPLPGGPWEDRARIIRDGARRRELSYALREITERITHDDFDTIRADLYTALDETKDTVQPVEYDRFNAVMSDVWSEFQQGMTLIPTGIGSINEKIRGVRRGSYIVLGARTSVGKTALAVSLVGTWARAGYRCSFMSVEMDRVSIGQRYAGVLGNISVAGLAAGELHPADVEQLNAIVSEDLPIAICDSVRSLAQVRSRAMQHRRLLGGLDILVVDYMQLMETDDEDTNDAKRYLALGKISKGLKYLGRDTGAVVIALAQLGRGADTKKQPQLSDLRESGNFEQDADQVWLLWRNEKRKCMELAIAKNRQGPTGRVALMYHASMTRFVEHIEDATPVDDSSE